MGCLGAPRLIYTFGPSHTKSPFFWLYPFLHNTLYARIHAETLFIFKLIPLVQQINSLFFGCGGVDMNGSGCWFGTRQRPLLGVIHSTPSSPKLSTRRSLLPYAEIVSVRRLLISPLTYSFHFLSPPPC